MTAFRPRQIYLAVLLVLLPTLADGAGEFEIVDSLGFRPRFLEPDARAIAMGTAVTAVAEGPAAPYWNLGVLGMPSPTCGFSYSTRETNARYHFFSVVGGWDGVGVGGHFTMMRDKYKVRTIFDPSETRTVEISHYFGLVGAGIDVGRYIPRLPEGMEWGTGLGIALAKNKVVTSEGDGWDMDLGTILSWRFPLEQSQGAATLILRTGYVLRDMWDRNIDVNGATIRLGRQDRIGMAAIMESAYDTRLGPLFQGTVSWERRGLFCDWGGSRNQVGGEITVAGILSLRNGYIWDEYGLDNNEFNWGLGFGLEPGNSVSPRLGVQLDYVEAEQNVGPDFDQFSASVWIVL